MSMTKYEWGAACRFFPGFRDAPGVVRTAWALCDLYNDEVGCAWPTRETLASALGAPPESVSKWIAALRDGGAIGVVNLNRLPAETRSKIGRSARRSQVYMLNFGWALEVLQLRDEQAEDRSLAIAQKVTVSPPLDLKGNGVATSKGGGVVTSKGGSTVTLIPYTHTLEDPLEKQEAQDVSELSVYTRETIPENVYSRAKGRAA